MLHNANKILKAIFIQMLFIKRRILSDHHKDLFTGSTYCSYMCSHEKAVLKFGIQFTGLTNLTPLLHSIMHF